MNVQGWIAFVPETLSIAFLPAKKDCISGELLEWQLLTVGQNLHRFTTEFEPKIELLGECRCYFVESDIETLENWFSTLSTEFSGTNDKDSVCIALAGSEVNEA